VPGLGFEPTTSVQFDLQIMSYAQVSLAL